MKVTIENVISVLEKSVPISLQESYDNCGLLVGDPQDEFKSALLCLDVTENVMYEAKSLGCNLIIAHHPLIFSGLKKINGSNSTQRILIEAIKNNICIYAAHTNFDNIGFGVNKKICDKLGLINCEILEPTKGNLLKLSTFVPFEHALEVREALFDAGAGTIGNYDHCSFNVEGIGTFRGNKESKPFVGEIENDHNEKEIKIEVILNDYVKNKVVSSLIKAHPYEEVAYDIIKLENANLRIGAGMIGELQNSIGEMEALKLISKTFNASVIRHTSLLDKPVKKIAVCGGSGSFLLKNAINRGADMFVSADFKYHQFFDSEGKIVIADVGHFETEQFTPEIFFALLQEKFSTFAFHLSKINTNPINYYKA